MGNGAYIGSMLDRFQSSPGLDPVIWSGGCHCASFISARSPATWFDRRPRTACQSGFLIDVLKTFENQRAEVIFQRHDSSISAAPVWSLPVCTQCIKLPGCSPDVESPNFGQVAWIMVLWSERFRAPRSAVGCEIPL